MRVFNLAEELEKERKKNKELKAKINLLEDNRIYLNNKIDKAMEYIEKTDTFQIVHSTDELAEMLREKTIKDLLDILKGSDNNE